MNTAKFLFTFCLILLSFNSLFASNTPGNDMQTGQSDNYCTCTCDACRNCNHRDPDKEAYYEENNFRIMNSRDFAEFKKFIADRTFESTKYDMTKSVADNNMFTTDQVRDILSWFVFESNKLDLAKYIFKNTADKNNYYKLYNIFVFESNVIDLDNYIKNYR